MLRCQLAAAGTNWSFEQPVSCVTVRASAGRKVLIWQSGSEGVMLEDAVAQRRRSSRYSLW